MFLGGRAGSGNQYISWIHIEDLCELFYCVIKNKNLNGIYNATTPDPVTNRFFCQLLRSTLQRPWSPPLPAVAVKIGAFLIGTAVEPVLTGTRCSAAKLIKTGFSFKFDELASALDNIFHGEI